MVTALLAVPRPGDDDRHMVLVLQIAAAWLLLSVLTAGVYAAICHGAELLESR